MRIFLAAWFILAFTVSGYAQFAADNLVVSQTSGTTTTGVTLSLAEYSLTGELKSTTAVGASNFYVGGAASSAAEGVLALSSDNKLLTLYGYSRTSPTTAGPSNNTSADNPRALAVIDASKNQSIITVADVHSGQAAKSAIAIPLSSNTYGVYLGGAGTGAATGLQYVTINTATNPATLVNAPVSLAKVNTRSVKIFNGQLYVSSSFQADKRLLAIGLGTPTATGQTAVSLPAPISQLETPNDFIFFGSNLLYVTEENSATGGIKKFYFDGTQWILLGLIDSGIANDYGFRGLTGRLENGVITLYGVTSSNTQNSLVKITDATPRDAATDRCTAGVSVQVLARATETTGFRGIAFTPNSNIVLPVSLTSFTAKLTGSDVLLQWTTSSEQNNSHFEILRSSDGKSFVTIGSVEAAGSSSNANKYSFKDSKAQSGVNYYQLKQVDKDGRSALYGPVSAKLALRDADLQVQASANAVNVTLYAAADSKNTRIILYDINGKKITEQTVNINAGINQVNIPVTLISGVYLLKITGQDILLSKKLVKG
ncbi:T9SS type A sorting domain-containing protein (plasmid) [Pedobacter sp. BS3]|uniref:T9SS type A sorting domain-containing protein n=1 Tax=Pedobacter sp. BS3 TaxID=2567937 RepID=UPI0011EC572A|nr:T9SS type A sorting domain-containing protein [Pedobacter sp. BS3]TZF86095.1 T9SS type A sorting domain-containing protein [Pedobacter sp. BS3]